MKKNVKKIIIGSLSTLLLYSIPVEAEIGETIYSVGNVNIRQSPDTESELVGVMPYNSEGIIIEDVDENGWMKIQSGNISGYVAGYYFSYTPFENGYTTAQNNAEMLYIRSDRSEDATIIGSLSYHDSVEIVEEYDGSAWVKIVTNDGLYGYVKADYVSLDTSYALAQDLYTEEEDNNYIYGNGEWSVTENYYYNDNYEVNNYDYNNNYEDNSSYNYNYENNSDYNYSDSSSYTYEDNSNYEEDYYEDNSSYEEEYYEESTSYSSNGGVSGVANQYVGSSYVYGGSSPSTGFDCSGLAQYSYAQNGISIPRTAADQYYGGTQIDVSTAVYTAGALIFYHDFGHVAISNGDGTVTHASNSTTGVIVSDAYYSTPCGAAIY